MNSFARLIPLCAREAHLCALILYSFGILAFAGILMRDLNRYSFILTIITTVFRMLSFSKIKCELIINKLLSGPRTGAMDMVAQR